MKSESDAPALTEGQIPAKPARAIKALGGKRALIRNYLRAGSAIVLMLLLAMACFVAGIFLPFTSVTKLWLFQNQISVYHGLIILWQAGELFLFLILFVFTICFPFVKLNAMLVLWLYPRVGTEHARNLFHFVSNMGKWSMLDVFVVAILVLTIKSTGVADIRVGDGFFLFFVSVMLTQFASLWTGRVVSHLTA
jgi:paraquat-inducible protein A